MPNPQQLAYWAELLLIQMIFPGVSWLGHLSGIIAGILFASDYTGFFDQPVQQRRRRFEDRVEQLGTDMNDDPGTQAAVAASLDDVRQARLARFETQQPRFRGGASGRR